MKKIRNMINNIGRLGISFAVIGVVDLYTAYDLFVDPKQAIAGGLVIAVVGLAFGKK